MNDYRIDNRTKEQFEYSIRRFSAEEKRYLNLFLTVHNDFRRKKRELTVIKWGNQNGGKIVYNTEEIKTYCRPDYLLCRCEDNSYFIKGIQPIEVQTCCELFPDICYIKKSKIDWSFDYITKKICNHNCSILFIVGTGFKGREKYKLLTDGDIYNIKKNGLRFPSFIGNKPCYFFYYSDYKWKPFEKNILQSTLEQMEKK